MYTRSNNIHNEDRYKIDMKPKRKLKNAVAEEVKFMIGKMIPKPSSSKSSVVGNNARRPPLGRRALSFKKKNKGEERNESSASKGDEARVILKRAKGGFLT
mmetsp:Transcript_16808/g.24888  ORF Transcript_16808/g.24888 Transcript_16808/m.24888 type:complete len:101 (+) Transcript_16808:643-945(+)